MSKWSLSQECTIDSTNTNEFHYISGEKKKIIICSSQQMQEKASNKVQCPFIITTLSKPEIERKFFKQIKLTLKSKLKLYS